MTLKTPVKFYFEDSDFDRIGLVCLVTEVNSIIQSLIKTRGNCFDSQTSDDKNQNWFLTHPSSVYEKTVGITQVISTPPMETSVSNTLCSVRRFSGLEAPARCKSEIVGIQSKKRCGLVSEGGGGVSSVAFTAEGAIWWGGVSNLRRWGYECFGLLAQQW